MSQNLADTACNYSRQNLIMCTTVAADQGSSKRKMKTFKKELAITRALQSTCNLKDGGFTQIWREINMTAARDAVNKYIYKVLYNTFDVFHNRNISYRQHSIVLKFTF